MENNYTDPYNSFNIYSLSELSGGKGFSGMSKGFSGMKKGFSGMNKGLNKMKSKMGNVKQKISGKLDNIKQQTSNLRANAAKQMGNVQREFENAKDNISNLEKMANVQIENISDDATQSTGLSFPPGLNDFLCTPSKVYLVCVLLLSLLYIGYSLYKKRKFSIYMSSCACCCIILISFTIAVMCAPYRIATWVIVVVYVLIGSCSILLI